MNWVLFLNIRIKKSVRRFPKKDRLRINEALAEMEGSPYTGDLVKVESEDNLWRRRVGAYRIKFQVREKEKVVYVYEISRRTSKTY